MSELPIASLDPVAGLLGDLETIASVARSGIRAADAMLEPGETRPCAILYLDVVGFTDLARSLSSDDLARLIDRTFRIFEATVNGSGGYCDKIIGDAALYVFPGHPHHAPACQAALHSALGVRRRLAQINQSLQSTGIRLAVRAGVTFGIVSRQRVGGGQQQVTVMGEMINLAQRLEATAAPDTICTVAEVVSETALLFDFEPLEPRDLKGFGPTAVFALSAERPREAHLRGAGALSPLTGRTELLETAGSIIEGWIDAGGCTGRVLLLQGPTAVGKSRTALELLQRVDSAYPALRTCTVHCTPQSGLLNLAADLCQLGHFEGGVAERWLDLTRNADDVAAETLQQSERMLAYLLQSGAGDSAAIGRMDSASFLQQCAQTLRTLFALVAAEAGPEGVLIVVAEDLQWSGRLPELLAPLLAQGALPCPVLVIATARPGAAAAEQVAALLGPDAEDERSAVLQVEPIGAAEGSALFRLLLPGIDLPPAVEAELHEKSLGLPYYYEEMARLLLRRGIVRQQPVAGQLCYTLTESLRELELPADFRMLILGRMDLLAPALRETAAHASVLGRSFQRRDYKELERRLGTLMTEDLQQRLDGLASERILISGDGEQYFFEHILTHEATYSALLSGNRHLLHSAAADITAERLVPGTAAEWEVLPELVRHLEGAARYAEACEKCCDLLQLMARNKLPNDWNDWELKARTLAGNLSSTSAASRVGSLIDWSKGVMQMYLGNVDEAQILLEGALLQHTGANSPQEARISLDLGTLYLNLVGDSSLAHGLFQSSYKISNDQQFDMESADSAYWLANLLHQQGHTGQAIEFFQTSLNMFEQLGHSQRAASAFNALGSCFIDELRIEEAIAAFGSALDSTRLSGNKITQAAALGNLGVAYRAKGDLVAALHSYEEALIQSSQVSWTLGEAYNLMNLGDLYLNLGDLEQSKIFLEKAADTFSQLKDDRGTGITYGTLGELYIKLNDMANARAVLGKADELLSRQGDALRRGLIMCSWVRLYLSESNGLMARTMLSRAKALNSHSSSGRPTVLAEAIAVAEAEIVAAVQLS